MITQAQKKLAKLKEQVKENENEASKLAKAVLEAEADVKFEASGGINIFKGLGNSKVY